MSSSDEFAFPDSGSYAINRCKELLITFSDIPTNIGDIFLSADATLASPEPPKSSLAR
jgi:hypothetical protein